MLELSKLSFFSQHIIILRSLRKNTPRIISLYYKNHITYSKKQSTRYNSKEKKKKKKKPQTINMSTT